MYWNTPKRETQHILSVYSPLFEKCILVISNSAFENVRQQYFQNKRQRYVILFMFVSLQLLFVG